MHVHKTEEEERWLEALQARVRAARRDLGWSQERLAEQASLSPDMVSRVERGTRIPSLLVLRRIARAVGRPLGTLLSAGEERAGLPGRMRPDVPLLGQVTAGLPELALEDPEAERVPCPPDCGRADYALRVRGDSMWGAGIHPDDIVFVRRDVDYADGDIVVALIDEEATVKRLQRHAGGFLLLAENPRYPPRLAPVERTRLLGQVVGVLRNLPAGSGGPGTLPAVTR